MEVRAIAVPHGAVPVWIRVGRQLDPVVAPRPDEVVTRIVSTATGFRIETLDPATATVRYYEIASCVVSLAESLSGDSYRVSRNAGHNVLTQQPASA